MSGRLLHLAAVAARDEAGPGHGAEGGVEVDHRGLPRQQAWAAQVESWARAADSSAGAVEQARELLRTARVDLMAQYAGSASERVAQAMTQLEAVAAVLGEMHGGLEELAYYGPGGAA